MSTRARVSQICTALSGVTEEGDQHLGYSVRGKRFAWLLDDHHGDGRLALNCKAPPGASAGLAAGDPERYFVPSYLGARGWVGLWLDTEEVDWDEVDRLLVDAYLLSAPKKLAAEVSGRTR